MASAFVPSSFLLFIVATVIALSQGQLDSNQPIYDLDVKSAKSSDEHVFNLIDSRRIKRDADDNESKFKKVSTKKPTEMIKPKPSSNPLKSMRSPSEADAASHPSLPSVGDLTPHALSAAPQTVATDSYMDSVDVTPPPNTTQKDDAHIYYNSTLLDKPEQVLPLWIDTNDEVALSHDMLSNSHRRAATIALKFSFPFYGHSIKNVTIATGGFLYMGDTVHSWLAATQYIAPLMANFDTSISNSSSIMYVSNETHFIVQWRSVELHDSTPPGNFSFQVTLKATGDIIFVYKHIPFPIAKIPDSKHPVKVGISDAYVIDRTVFFIRRKTIYEYHRAELSKEPISNDTAIYFTALPTCVSLTTCETCYSSKLQSFDCKWCAAVNRCSDGFDRFRQEWLTNKCDVNASSKENADNCKVPPVTSSSTSSPSSIVPASSSSSIPSAKSKTDSDDISGSFDYKHSAHSAAEDAAHSGRAGVVSFMIFFGLIAGIGLWVFYAYRNPQTSSGQFLIRYRPAEWRWNSNGDTRYTAASIHM